MFNGGFAFGYLDSYVEKRFCFVTKDEIHVYIIDFFLNHICCFYILWRYKNLWCFLNFVLVIH